MRLAGPIVTLGSRLMRLVYARYVLASVAALGTDIATFLLLMAAGTRAALASAAGYGVGIVVHWLISSRLVFAGAADVRGADRHRQKALFLASAFVGLALTVAIVAAGEAAGFDPRIAKLVAVIAAFQTTYVLRRTIVFAAR